MTYAKNPGLLLLAIWLLLTGLIALFGLSFTNLGLLMALLALVAGAAILLESSRIFKRVRRERTAAMVLLGIWLLLTGLLAITNTSFEGQGLIMGLLALAAGILVLIGR